MRGLHGRTISFPNQPDVNRHNGAVQIEFFDRSSFPETMKTPNSSTPLFRKKMIVRPSGHGRTASWPKSDEGTVVRVSKRSVFVQWHGTCVEDQMEPSELADTGRINAEITSGIKVLTSTKTGPALAPA